jgi:hypothetical protein
MAEKRTIELEIQDNSKSLKTQYREAVAELQKLAATYGETSDQAAMAAKKAAELKDQIEFSKDLIKGFNPDAKFQAVEGAINGVMNGFQAFEGGLALLGVESDKVQEAMLRVQAVMALTQGINGVMQAKDAFSQLGTVAKTALKGIKTELIATGIGALVVALGTIVAYWDDIKGLVNGVNDETQKNVELTQQKLTKTERELEVFEKQENSLRLQGKSEEEIIKLREQKIQKIIETAKKEKALQEQNKKAEVAAAERNQTFARYIIQTYATGLSMGLYIITGIIDGISNAFIFLAKSAFNFGKQLRGIMFEALISPLELALTGVNKLLELAGASTFDTKAIFGNIRDTYAGIEKQIGGFINSLEGTSLSKGLFELTDKYVSQQLASVLFDPKAVADSYDKTIQGLDDKILDGEDRIAQRKLEQNKKNQQNNKDQNDKNAKETLDLERQNTDKRLALMKEGYDKEIALANEKAKREKEDLLKDAEGKIVDAQALADAQKLIEDNLTKDLKAIDDKYNKEKYDKQQEALKAQIKAEDDAWNLLQKSRNSKQEQELLELQQAFDAKIEQANGNAEVEKAVTEQFNKEYAAINKRYKDEQDKLDEENKKKKKAEIKELNEYRVQSAQDTLQVVSNLAELFAGKSEKQQKKAFQVQKAVNIANAVIDTYKAANTALASSPPPFNYIAMAAAITAGLINVKKIASQQFQSSSSSGGGGGSNAPTGAAPMTANFNTIGSSGINQLAQLQQTPTQAYVVSGEVTSAQALDRNRVQNATL